MKMLGTKSHLIVRIEDEKYRGSLNLDYWTTYCIQHLLAGQGGPGFEERRD